MRVNPACYSPYNWIPVTVPTAIRLKSVSINNDRYRFRFEIQPNSSTTQLDPSDAYRLAGRMLWGDEWLLEHLPIQQGRLVNPVLEHDPFRKDGDLLDPHLGEGPGLNDGSRFK